MNSKRCFLLGLLLFCLTVLLSAGDGEDDTKEAEIIRVTGTVRLVGSGNFPHLVITSSRVQWYIAEEDENKLHDLQHQTVTLEGEEILIKLNSANGRRTFTRRELRNIKIIAVNGRSPVADTGS